LNQAVALHQQGRRGEAELMYRQIIELDPNNAEAIHLLGVIAYEAGHAAEAVKIIRDALTLDPRNAAAHSNFGLALMRVDQVEQALAEFEHAIRLKPAYPEALYNRGNALRQLSRHEEALASYDKAIALRPKYFDVHVNRGRALASLGRLPEAVAATDRALHLQPDNPSAVLNKAITLLAMGDFEQGLPLYEARWREPQMEGARRDFPAPMWNGREPLAGRKLLIHAEQGLGDTIQFSRYAPLLADRGARVILEVQPPLVSLLRTLDRVSAVIARGGVLPDFDLHCPMLSMPLVRGTTLKTIPASPCYLRADDDRVTAWQQRLGGRRHAAGGLRIGVIASGNPKYQKDRDRSVPLAKLATLFGPDREFICLQKELRQEDRDLIHAHADRIRSFADELTDFAETAALIACTDLVIAVDTAGAHLAGALGKPLWVLLPFAGDWRWLRDRADSPWYPSARLFRQPKPGDWDSVVAALGAALEQIPR
jgi:Tfp pilus assembly protein PilF